MVAATGGVWWAMRGKKDPLPMATVAPVPSAIPKAPASVENPAERVERLAKDFGQVQARAAGIDLDDGARRRLAEATLFAAGARTRSESGDLAGAVQEWAKAMAEAGPVVLAAVVARYEKEAGALRGVRLEDQGAPAAQALRRALEGATDAAARGEWAEAIAKRDEAAALLDGARKAIAAQLADAADGAAARADTAMATLFHERALRLDGSLGSCREYLYRHKFKPGEILSTAGGVELAYAPPGEFSRGSPGGEAGRDADETPQRVSLTKGLFIAVNETTQREWDRVMGEGAALRTLRSAKAKPELISPELPMHSVTWAQAGEYCRRLSELEGLIFRLPTEAEWEYACRAGTSTAFNLSVDGLSARDANIDDGTGSVPLAPRAPGASGRANAWGLRDMHGNVWEWCADWSAAYPATASLSDPTGPEQESLGSIDLAMKIVRGGGWNAPANDARSANRWEYAPAVATPYIGLRVAHEPDLARP
jgi:formylglycine-generating enzyme required for sulfatase activity